MNEKREQEYGHLYGQDAIRKLQDAENESFYALIDDPYMKQLAGRYYPQYREQWVKVYHDTGRIAEMYSAEGVTSFWAYIWPLWGLYHFIWWMPVWFFVFCLAAYAELAVFHTRWTGIVFFISLGVFPKSAQGTLFYVLSERCKKARSMNDADAWRYVQRMTGGNFLSVLLGGMVLCAGLYYGVWLINVLLVHFGHAGT